MPEVNKTTGTYNRGKLKREIIAGKWLVKCNGRYTDDYAYDVAYNYGVTDFTLAGYFPSYHTWLKEIKAIMPNKTEEVAKEYSDKYDTAKAETTKGCNKVFDDHDFRGYGHAYGLEDGTVCLSFGYESFTFKKK
jgi:hypothetical protein